MVDRFSSVVSCHKAPEIIVRWNSKQAEYNFNYITESVLHFSIVFEIFPRALT